MKRIKILIASLTILFGYTVIAIPTAVNAATPQSTVCQSLGSSSDCKTNPSGGISLTKVVRVVVNILSVAVGIAAVIMIIIGGFKYVTSNGDSNAVSSAKNTVLYAIIGIIIVAMAQFIVQFIVNRTT